MLNIAHRGARSLAPENTLVSARQAYRLGADLWELDVRMTRDNRLVVMHDNSLERTTDVEEVYPKRSSYALSTFDLKEVRRLDAGSWYGKEDPFGEIKKGNVDRQQLEKYTGQKVPTLEEALELTNKYSWKVNLEIKSGENPSSFNEEKMERLIRKVVSLVEKTKIVSEVLISSFHPSVIRMVKNLNPDISKGLLLNEIPSNPTDMLEGMVVETVNLADSILKKNPELSDLKEVLRKTGHPPAVIVWTVNEVDRLKELTINPLVDGIITDYPQRIAGIIEESSAE